MSDGGGERYEIEIDPVDDQDFHETVRRAEFGICVSGGGIRAAAFGLGALQSIQQRTQLVAGKEPAAYISAVSGGSYIVGGIAMLKSGYAHRPANVKRRRREALEQRRSAATPITSVDPDRAREAEAILDPFGPGSPELEHVRRHARYLVGGLGSVNLVLELLVRLALNVGVVGLAIFVPARVLGWGMGAAIDSLGDADRTGDEFQLGTLFWPAAIGIAAVAIALVPLAFMIGTMRSPASPRYEKWMRFVSICAITGVTLLVFAVLLPRALEFVAHLTSSSEPPDDPTPTQPATSSDLGRLTWIGGLSGAATVLTSILGLRSATAGTPQGSSVPNRLIRGLVKLGRALMALIATVSVPVLLGIIAVSGVYLGATNVPWSADEHGWPEYLLVGLMAFVLLTIAVNADPVKWSLYPFYKRRLMRCFCVERYKDSDPRWTAVEESVWSDTSMGASEGEWRARERPYTNAYRLSASQPKDIPIVLICAAANVSEFGESPAGQGVLPFIFSADAVGFPPGIVVPPGPHGAFDTEQLERALARNRWLEWRNAPNVGAKAMRFVRGSLDPNYLSMPSAIATTGAAVSPMMGKMTIAPFRALFALLNIRLGIWLPNPTDKRIRAQVNRTGRTPLVSRRRPLAIFRESFGRQGLGRKLVYVSDGGHYENLGLVELLRRGCTKIICVDASGDHPGKVNTLTEAMLLAQGEFGVSWQQPEGDDYAQRFSLDGDRTKERGRPTMHSTWSRIEFNYRDQQPGVVLVLKVGVSAKTTAHLLQFQDRNKTFPYDSTGNQLFRADRFDAYVALGRDTADQALQSLWTEINNLDVRLDGDDTASVRSLTDE